MRWKTINPLDLAQELQSHDFDYFLDKLLSQISDDLDKREGSIVYDAIAPCAAALAEQSLLMANLVLQSHRETATGEFLDYASHDDGTNREPATFAKAKATATDENGNTVTSISVGDRFSSIGAEPIFYSVVQVNNDYSFILKSELAGDIANDYVGQILPITPNDSINWAEIKVITEPARDAENDETLRQRLLNPTSYISYGGNFSDYQNMLKKIDEVGKAQIYPCYKGANYIKVAILDNKLNPASAELINDVKQQLDPTGNSGKGYGLAPIGHKVDVVAPTLLDISVQSHVVTDNKVSNDVVNAEIKQAIQTYFYQIKQQWDEQSNHKYDMTVYRSQVLATILSQQHVVNAELPTLNGKAEDIKLVMNNETTQLPSLKEVVINE